MFQQGINIHKSISFYQVHIDIWHFSSVGIMIMIMNVLWEDLKSISASPCAGDDCRNHVRVQKRSKVVHAVHTCVPCYMHTTHRDLPNINITKNKDCTQRNICVSIYVKGIMKHSILTWQRSNNIYKRHFSEIPSCGWAADQRSELEGQMNE